jgi:hypothetical protein
MSLQLTHLWGLTPSQMISVFGGALSLAVMLVVSPSVYTAALSGFLFGSTCTFVYCTYQVSLVVRERDK